MKINVERVLCWQYLHVGEQRLGQKDQLRTNSETGGGFN